MKTESIKDSKSSWPKVVDWKWLNLKRGGNPSSSDSSLNGVEGKDGREGCGQEGRYVVVPEELSGRWLMKANDDSGRSDMPMATGILNLRIFVGTWNVGGKPPDDGLNLRDWLRTPAPADIYVLGFQEIVPLNAGNVLVAEDRSPAAKWLCLIRHALNSSQNDPEHPNNYDTTTSACNLPQQPNPSVSFSGLISTEDQPDQEQFESFFSANQPPGSNERHKGGPIEDLRSRGTFHLAASKQMVGLFLCVFVRCNLHAEISSLNVSCVGRGIMGYLGNKGSISISMTLYKTTFCFVCTHLASGEKEGDEFKRNSDVVEILRKTRFARPVRDPRRQRSRADNILDHESGSKIIWLGDLNYRLSSSCGDMLELLKRNDWQSLLEKDQLRIERRAGRVFKGWEEGMICFAPTYKYRTNSDHYVAQTSTTKEKRRAPAWCDRILWRGEGLKQMWYVRGESKFSDHRPVYSLFSVQISVHPNKDWPTRPICQDTSISMPPTLRPISLLPSKVQAEEVLLLTRALTYSRTIPRFSVTEPTAGC